MDNQNENFENIESVVESVLANNRDAIILKDKNGEIIGIATPRSNESKQLMFDFYGEQTEADEPIIKDYNTYGSTSEFTTPVWIWSDPIIFDDETKAAFLELPASERPRFTTAIIDKFYAARPEYNTFAHLTIYENPLLLLELFKSLTPNDFKICRVNNPKERFELLQNRIAAAERAIAKTPIDTENLATIWPILSIRELFLESELSNFFYLKNPHISSKEHARNAGALMTTAGRLADISNKDYTGWLDEVPNSTAYLYYVGPHYWDEIEVDEGGNLYEGDEAQVRRAARSEEKKVKKAFENGTFGNERPKGHERINKEIMRALLKATIAENGAIRTIYLPTFAHELNENYKIDVDEYDDAGNLNEKGKQNKAAAEDRAKEAAAARESGEKVYTKEKPSIMQQFYSLDYWVGILDSEEVKRTAVITGINREARTIDVVLPYIEATRQRIIEAQELEAIQSKRKYLIPAYNDLVHSNIESERNKLAVDLVYTIIDKLLQRGSKPASKFKENQTEDGPEKDAADEKVVYRIKYSTLINDTPLLAMAYKNADGSKRKYDVLDRTFKKAFQLLHKKTDIYDYFVDLKIPETPPTKRTIEDILIITHRGANPNYKRNK